MKTPWIRIGRMLTFAAGACLAAMPLACGNLGKAPPAIGKMGERVVAGGEALTVEYVDRVAPTLKPEAGKKYLVANVLIENAGDGKAPYNPLLFGVKDDKGVQSPGELGVNLSEKGRLGVGYLDKGDKVRGEVAFQINADSTGLVLVYERPGAQAIQITLDK